MKERIQWFLETWSTKLCITPIAEHLPAISETRIMHRCLPFHVYYDYGTDIGGTEIFNADAYVNRMWSLQRDIKYFLI